MRGDEEPVRIPISEVFNLHAVEPREVAAVVEAYLEEAERHRRRAEDRALTETCQGTAGGEFAYWRLPAN